MQRPRHETVATVLVDPAALLALELELVGLDLWLWPVATAPNAVDGPRQAFQLRRRLVEAQRGGWDAAAEWVVCWISFGDTWREGAEPVSWQARRTLYAALDAHADHVRYRRGLGGVAPLAAPHERTA
ncbi:hypothetical protein [Nocardioides aestuarii]|uniref:Uncharacterized protein n=1 Tax=Nocardioides aestuarii TaxID=252231 RepID=A0ABW4TM28_9ACTN